jgi:hypothetical protein
VIHLYIGGSRDGPLVKVTSLRGGRPRDRGTVLGSGRGFGFSKRPRTKLGQHSIRFNERKGAHLSLLADRWGAQLTNQVSPSSGDFILCGNIFPYSKGSSRCGSEYHSGNNWCILYYEQRKHNYFTNYHTPTCSDAVV